MTRVNELRKRISDTGSFLCVGLDPDIDKLPDCVSKNPQGVYTFLKNIIDSTSDYCCSYKLNFGFFEYFGGEGFDLIKDLLKLIPKSHYTIADAKRGDIGNTAKFYARSVFEKMDFDSVTLSPYMGRDSILPFLEYEDKAAIILALTSNRGSVDFQLKKLPNNRFLYEDVIKTCAEWGNTDQIMFVVGATYSNILKNIRNMAPDHFFLIPGVGAQGGSLDLVVQHGTDSKGMGIMVNSSRGILYASKGEDYAQASARAAKDLHDKMKEVLSLTFGT